MKIALTQFAADADPAKNLAKQLEMTRAAADGGAKIVCTQELFMSKYFCVGLDGRNFDLAQKIPSAALESLCAQAKACGVVMVASLFEDRGNGVYHNSAAVIDADGSFLGLYRKNHIPHDPNFEEKYYFAPGDLGYRAWDTAFGRIGVLICWDQWFPEAARLTAMDGADIVFYPTAIGCISGESVGDAENFSGAWETVQRGHAVANGCYVAAANRVGTEEAPNGGFVKFWGGSFCANPYGRVIAKASADSEEILFAEVDFGLVAEFRRTWPFFRDRRIDTYSDILKRLKK